MKLIDNDSVVCITPLQLKKANLLFVNGEFYKYLSDTLRTFALKESKAITAQHNLILNYENQLSLKSEVIFNYEEVSASYKKQIQKQEIQIKWLKNQRTTFAIVGIAAICKIFLFH